MNPKQNKLGDWFFVCTRYPQCRGTRSIYIDRPDPFYAVANGLAVLSNELKLSREQSQGRGEALGNSIQHVTRIDRVVADYWRSKAR